MSDENKDYILNPKNQKLNNKNLSFFRSNFIMPIPIRFNQSLQRRVIPFSMKIDQNNNSESTHFQTFNTQPQISYIHPNDLPVQLESSVFFSSKNSREFYRKLIHKMGEAHDISPEIEEKENAVLDMLKNTPIGFDINQMHENSTLLIQACIHNLLKVVKRLIELKADVNQREENGNTAILFSVVEYNHSIVKYLLQHEADPNIVNSLGVSPIYRAILDKNKYMIMTLINGGRVDITTKLYHLGQTKTPLELSEEVFCGEEDFLVDLRKAASDKNFRFKIEEDIKEKKSIKAASVVFPGSFFPSSSNFTNNALNIAPSFNSLVLGKRPRAQNDDVNNQENFQNKKPKI